MEQEKKRKSFKEMANEMLDKDDDFASLDKDTQKRVRNFVDVLDGVDPSPLIEALTGIKRKQNKRADEMAIASSHSIVSGRNGTSVMTVNGHTESGSVQFSFALTCRENIDPVATALQILKTTFNDVKQNN